jgi:hypothetical protein
MPSRSYEAYAKGVEEIMSNEYRRRITEGGELGEQFWKDLDAAFDRGEDLTKWLRTRGLSDAIIESIKAVYPNTPRRD